MNAQTTVTHQVVKPSVVKKGNLNYIFIVLLFVLCGVLSGALLNVMKSVSTLNVNISAQASKLFEIERANQVNVVQLFENDESFADKLQVQQKQMLVQQMEAIEQNQRLLKLEDSIKEMLSNQSVLMSENVQLKKMLADLSNRTF